MANVSYQNQKDNLQVLQQQQQKEIRPAAVTIEQEQKDKTVEVINEKPTLANKKKKKIKNVDNTKKMKKKKRGEKSKTFK